MPIKDLHSYKIQEEKHGRCPLELTALQENVLASLLSGLPSVFIENTGSFFLRSFENLENLVGFIPIFSNSKTFRENARD